MSSGAVRDILILCNQSFSKRICMEIESFRWNLIHADAIKMKLLLKPLEICSRCIYVEKEKGILVSQKYCRQSFLPNGMNPELLTSTLSANGMLKDCSPNHTYDGLQMNDSATAYNNKKCFLFCLPYWVTFIFKNSMYSF